MVAASGQIMETRERPFNGLAVTGFICSLLWLFGVGSAAGIIMSGIAMQQRGKDGRSLAVAGLIIGILGLFPVVLIVVVALLSNSQAQMFQDVTNQLGQ